ncbi:ABC transporter permease subunit/CPBP intramembrane protease [Gimesia maris]|uniref:ABC-2 family transporter protein n=1 Tax=Gimesia maris TaxID=122 RepID=A0ABX5YQS1_9PLAN|nr:ABC transporter permease subunit/CPBP intramembrane protease [Gimesia maris]EDL58213.1 probable sodium extrusion protein NatB [Gimesia maris DSM 8797]QDU16087.1 ABC-2 family transporter protein [Gimesia maris]QEG18114.1 ABC-2 family transporter protein [Gimesia maris]QGQ28875.1 CPBP family intramembrane metalloprotease [Gimesia maris]
MASPYDQDSDDRIYTPTRSFRFSGLLRKELREILRDRRTVITLILMPLLVYPLLGLMLQKFFLSQASQLNEIEYRIVLPNESEGQMFRALFEEGDKILSERNHSIKKLKPVQENQTDNALAAFQDVQPVVKFMIADSTGENHNILKLVREGVVDVGVRYFPIEVKNEKAQQKEHSGRFQIIYGAQSAHSKRAAEYVEERLQAVRWNYRDQMLTNMGESATVPFVTSFSSVKSEMVQAYSLVTIVPLILILMTMTGAVYPAIDLTAGERERGTLETLISAPLPRMWILCAKFISVLVVAVMTALVNMTAMLATAYANGLETVLFGEGLTPFVLMEILLLLVIFAAFFSAVLLCITSFARSFKEAQAYLIPLMLISMAPGILGMVPDLKMTPLWAVIPLANIVLLSRDFLLHEAEPLLFFISVFSTLFYGIVALSLAARIFGTDTILYQSETSWSDFFRRSRKTHQYPALNNAMLCLAVMFPVFILSAAFVGRLRELTISQRLLVSGVLTFCLFLLIPLLFAWLGGVNLKTGFRWFKPRVVSCLGAVLLGFTLWPFAYEIEIFALTDTRIETLSRLFESMKIELAAVPLWVKLISLAVMPAVCEELFFRGYLLSSLLHRFSNWWAILASSLLFALFHVIVRDSLFIERFFPSFFMGLCLAYVNVRSRSVIPGILLHMIHNGLLITIASYQNYFVDWEINIENQKHLPVSWLVGSFLAVVIGFALVRLSNRRPSIPATETPAAEMAAS